tara:strand:+ start:782 stop:1855 length:1074 start_codon:yes stop_codon:yes gene_type:complete
MTIKNNFLLDYKKIKVLVTGSTGFKGSWLCFWLNSIKSKVIGVGLRPEKNSILFKSLDLDKKIKQYYIDITDFNKLNSIIKKEKPDIIFHLAAQSIVSESFINPLPTIKTNVMGSANILESVKINKIPSLVYITSDKCYLNIEKNSSYKESDELGGYDNYSSSKAAAEILFHSYHNSYFKKKYLSHGTARAGNVIGGGDTKKNRIIPDIINSLEKNKKIYIRSPNSTRPWQHVLEPLSGYLKLGSKLMNKEIRGTINPNWNFGPHKHNCKKVSEILNRVINLWGKKNYQIIIDKNKKFKESKLLSLNIKKARQEIKWNPRLSLNEALNLTVSWYKNYYQSKSIVSLTEEQIEFYLEK